MARSVGLKRRQLLGAASREGSQESHFPGPHSMSKCWLTGTPWSTPGVIHFSASWSLLPIPVPSYPSSLRLNFIASRKLSLTLLDWVKHHLFSMSLWIPITFLCCANYDCCYILILFTVVLLRRFRRQGQCFVPHCIPSTWNTEDTAK